MGILKHLSFIYKTWNHFRAERKDIALMILGSICSMIGGAGVPVFMYIFGGLYRDLANPTKAVASANSTEETPNLNYGCKFEF